RMPTRAGSDAAANSRSRWSTARAPITASLATAASRATSSAPPSASMSCRISGLAEGRMGTWGLCPDVFAEGIGQFPTTQLPKTKLSGATPKLRNSQAAQLPSCATPNLSWELGVGSWDLGVLGVGPLGINWELGVAELRR